MPTFQKAERLTKVLWADSQAVKTWRDKARVQAISAMAIVTNPDYAVFAVRNSRDTLLGLAAIREGEEEVLLLHLASRDPGKGVGTMLVNEVISLAGDRKVKTVPAQGAGSFYKRLGWRHIGLEYWSK